MVMKELLERFENKSPEIVFHWNDPETEAEGWTVINSLRGGAAGGGTRMREGLDMNEVLSLAKTMEVKFTISGPPIGGAKSGINFNPEDPRKKGVLERWYAEHRAGRADRSKILWAAFTLRWWETRCGRRAARPETSPAVVA